MMKVATSMLVCLLAAGAYANGPCHKASTFKYDFDKGKCVNAEGKVGLNKAHPDKLFKDFDERTRSYAAADAECVDFRGFKFADHMGGFASRKLVGWNLKGADLRDADLHFAYIDQSDFSGTNMKSLSWGYASLIGTIDEHTVLPEGCTSPDQKTINCFQ